jgi:hypothetical protein
VVIVSVVVAPLPFGVTAFGDKLQVVNAGTPLQISVIILLKTPPTGETVSW